MLLRVRAGLYGACTRLDDRVDFQSFKFVLVATASACKISNRCTVCLLHVME
jgi:hypothetical protein